MKTADLIEKALVSPSTTPEIIIYWDRQDPDNTGPAYRRTDVQESGPLELLRWHGDAIGAHLEDFFRSDSYLGHGQAGTYQSRLHLPMKTRTIALIILAMLAFHAAFAVICSSIKIGS